MKYRVLKDCLNPFKVAPMLAGREFEISEKEFNGNLAKDRIIFAGLIEHGFIEEIKDEPWKPKVDIDTYYTIEFDNEVDAHIWSDSEIDKSYMKIGNCFQTKVQAEDAIEWLKAFKVLREDTKGFKPDWKDFDQQKWYVCYQHISDDLCVFYCKNEQTNILYFATEADAEESIKAHRDAWLTFLGVEEEE